MIGLTLAALACAVWVHLAVARGGFWRARDDDRWMHAALPDALRRIERWPRVVAVIPARDEAQSVGTTVRSLLDQLYPGVLSIVVVDDHSDDGTAAVARRAALEAGQAERLTVLSAPPLPGGWTGKVAAMAHGVAHAGHESPDYWLLTDADIAYEPDAVAALVSSAVEKRLVLSSLMVELRCESVAERTGIPALIFFFQMLYPFSWVNQQGRRTAAAAGGCMLVPARALEAAGGLAAIRGELIDDCALARLLKPRGPIHLALTERVRSLRRYESLHDIRRMVARTAFTQLRHSPWRLFAVVLAMLVVFIVPVVLAIVGQGWTRALALAAWGSMALLFVPILRRYRVAAWWSVALPAIAAAYLAFTVESALAHWRGRGGLWKGRVNRPVPRT